MDAQTPSAEQILDQILPFSAGPDFAPDTLHGHSIGWTIKEWPRGPYGGAFKSFRSTPLPVPAPFGRCFKEVYLSGEIGQTPEGRDEFPVSVSLSWTSHAGGTNGVEIGTFFFRTQTGVLFAHRLASNGHNVVFV